MAIYEAFDVVIVPFPFTDRTTTRRRPALVISKAESFNRMAVHCVLAMITSARQSVWPLDIPIEDLDSAGLPAPSLVRMKLFTLDTRLVLQQVGSLSFGDREQVQGSLRALLAVG